MSVIIGIAVVIFTVFGGFLLEGGHIMVLFQPIELLIIGGAAVGALLISAQPSVVKGLMQKLGAVFKGAETTQTQYLEVLLCLYDLIKTAKGNLLGLEPHVEDPHSSEIFKKYPYVLHHHHALHFICDTLKVQISSPVSPYDLEELMDTDINAAHNEELEIPAALNRVSDAMPGLGIVAAVLGIVITMGKLTQGKEVIGHSVGAALVGTFLGILMSYGFLGPLAAKMDAGIKNEGKVVEVCKAALLAFAKNCSPKVCVEFARRSVPPTVRPGFSDVDAATQGQGKAA